MVSIVIHHNIVFVHVVIVLLELFTRNVIDHVERSVILETSIIFPYITFLLHQMNVPTKPVQSRLFIKVDAVMNISLAPLFASKNTFSPIGTLAPLVPPELVDQFVVESQYPFPHDTQYLSVAGFVDHPIFHDTYVLFVPATHVAPPVTPMSCIDR